MLAINIGAGPGASLAASNHAAAALLNDMGPFYPIDSTTSVAASAKGVFLIDLSRDGAIKQLGQGQALDVQTLTNPGKVILLTAGTGNTLEKHVYNADGQELGTTRYPIHAPTGGKVKWAAPAAKVNERIMVQEGNQFTLYSNTGKPVVKYDAEIKPKSSYEFVNIVDWDFSAYPYLAIKYEGQRIMAEDFFVHIVNLYSKSVTKAPMLEIDQQLQINSLGQLHVWNSYSYEEIMPPNATQPDPGAAQSFYSLFSLSTGKKLADHQRVFTRVDGGAELGGWNTQLAGDTVFVQDLATEQWSLFPANGQKAIAADLTGVAKGARFLGFDRTTGTVYFLTQAEGEELQVSKVKIN
ncbi:hypothetical protein ['Paenibacillus yunnanensis' Narsing Rao et al. 2020]|uniref:hypothetical protein n=1 Tax=Paenibacillus tengchongensis TaxID=2608684 RepID=UPI001651B25C|nr:hypothetical protein [Paenibacillus tengchongensis]